MELPGWYGFGTGIEAYLAAEPHGLALLRRLYRGWSPFGSIVDNSELALARVELAVGRRYAALARAGLPDAREADRVWAAIEAEYERSVAAVAAITGRQQLLADVPVVRAAIDRRNPDVALLSAIQVSLLAELRGIDRQPDGRITPERRDRLTRLVQLTLNGVAAGLQTTG